MDINRIKKLAGIIKEQDILGDLEKDPFEVEDDKLFNKETKAKKAIQYAFEKIGLEVSTVSEYPIYYDEKSREASVELDDNEVDLRQLARLYETGLSDNFRIIGSDDALYINFQVDKDIVF